MNTFLKNRRKSKAQKMEESRAAVGKGGIFALYKLFHRYYFKSFFGPFFAFIFPIIIYGIIGNLLGHRIMFAGMCAMTGVSVGLNGLPFSIIELKKSVLMKRVGSSPVKPSAFTTVIISYLSFLIFLSIFWIMIWSLIIFQDQQMFAPLGTVVGFFGFFYGNILNIVASMALGFALATFAKSEQSVQVLSTLIFFPSMFLSGMFFPIDSISKVPALDWISRFTPFRYTVMIINESWTGDLPQVITNATQITSVGNPFLIHDFYVTRAKTDLIFDPVDLSTLPLEAAVNSSRTKLGDFALLVFDVPDHVLGYVYPYTLILASTIFAVKRFSWSASR